MRQHLITAAGAGTRHSECLRSRQFFPRTRADPTRSNVCVGLVCVLAVAGGVGDVRGGVQNGVAKCEAGKVPVRPAARPREAGARLWNTRDSDKIEG